MRILLLSTILPILVVGCSDDKSSATGNDASFSGMVESQVEAMDKARAVEGALKDAVSKRREQSE